LPHITKVVCEKSFKKLSCIDRKIIVFEVMKKSFFTPCKIGLANFESSWLTTLVLSKVEAFDIMLGD
jgi:hypothetical protein